jgi:hypothetical protein
VTLEVAYKQPHTWLYFVSAGLIAFVIAIIFGSKAVRT